MDINVINLKSEKPEQYVRKGTLLNLGNDYLLFAQTGFGKFNFIELTTGNRQMDEFTLPSKLHDKLIRDQGLELSKLIAWLDPTWTDARGLKVVEPSDIELNITHRS